MIKYRKISEIWIKFGRFILLIARKPETVDLCDPRSQIQPNPESQIPDPRPELRIGIGTSWRRVEGFTAMAG